MKRIAIIGSGGSGKSTLAVQLGRMLDLPVFHLDRLYWNPGWIETEKGKWKVVQSEICSRPEWIIDGNYGGTMDHRIAACDTVIFLNLPRILCLLGALKRAIRYRNRTRPDMAEGCEERITREFLRWIWDYPNTRTPVILTKLQRVKESKKVIVLRSRRAVREFLATTARTNQ